jgi:hypothetical protein
VVWQAEIRLSDIRVPADDRLPGANSFKDTAMVLARARIALRVDALGHAVACGMQLQDHAAELRQWRATMACDVNCAVSPAGLDDNASAGLRGDGIGKLDDDGDAPRRASVPGGARRAESGCSRAGE